MTCSMRAMINLITNTLKFKSASLVVNFLNNFIMDQISVVTPAFTMSMDSKIDSLEMLRHEFSCRFGSVDIIPYKLVPLTSEDDLSNISNFAIKTASNLSVQTISESL